MADRIKVVTLRQAPPLTDVSGRLRWLADEIEAGGCGEVTGAIVVVPVEEDYPAIFGFGDVEGESQPIVQLELAKAWFVNQITRRA